MIHTHRSLYMYLAGAIRDGHPEDIQWREDFINGLQDHPVQILNPLGGKSFDKSTGLWSVSGIPSSAEFIVDHDFWAVDISDIIVFNFLALGDRYPNIGTLTEWGRSTKRAILRYSILPERYSGHENNKMFGLHPFIARRSAAIFHSTDACLDFLRQHISVLTGLDSRFRGGVY